MAGCGVAMRRDGRCELQIGDGRAPADMLMVHSCRDLQPCKGWLSDAGWMGRERPIQLTPRTDADAPNKHLFQGHDAIGKRSAHRLPMFALMSPNNPSCSQSAS